MNRPLTLILLPFCFATSSCFDNLTAKSAVECRGGVWKKGGAFVKMHVAVEVPLIGDPYSRIPTRCEGLLVRFEGERTMSISIDLQKLSDNSGGRTIPIEIEAEGRASWEKKLNAPVFYVNSVKKLRIL